MKNNEEIKAASVKELIVALQKIQDEDPGADLQWNGWDDGSIIVYLGGDKACYVAPK